MKKSYLLLLLLIFTTSLSFGQLAAEKLILGQWDLVKIKVKYSDCYGFYIHELNPCDTLFFEVDSSLKKMRIKFYEKYAIMSYGQKMQQCTFDFNDTIVDPYFKNLGEVENDFYYTIEPYKIKSLLKFSYKKNKLKLSKLLYRIDHIDNSNLVISTNSYDYGFNSKTTYFYTKSTIKKDSIKLSEKDLYGSWNNYNGTDDEFYKGVYLDTFLLTKKGFDSTQSVYGCSFDFQFENQLISKEYNVLNIGQISNIGEIERTKMFIIDGVYVIENTYPKNWKLDYENQILYFYTITFNDNHERIETITTKLKINYLGDGVLQCIRLPLE
jgi:hypothetical protein